MNLKSFEGGFDKNLSYLIWCEESLDAAIIDPSVELTEIIEYIQTMNLKLGKVFITHSHSDHTQYLNELMYSYPLIQVCGHSKPLKKFSAYRALEHLENISIGKEMMTILHTPGHLEDSICLWNMKQKLLFTGDTIFVGRTGRTIHKYSCIKKLYNSVYKIILKLPINTIIYPGHNYGHTKKISILENIKLSSFFQCNSKNEFIGVMKKFEDNRK